MIVERKSNKSTIVIWGIITLLIVIIIIIINVVMFATNKGLYGPYKPPPPPDDSVSPNGNPSAPDATANLLFFNAPVLSNKNTNLTGYNAASAKTNPSEWGFYLSSAF
jgi:hypothetical protein